MTHAEHLAALAAIDAFLSAETETDEDREIAAELSAKRAARLEYETEAKRRGLMLSNGRYAI